MSLSGGFGETGSGSGFPDAFAGNQGTILLAALKSLNFVTGVSGWRIQRNGNAEFNNVTIRGGVIVSGSALYYSTSPGQFNKLIASISESGGIDQYGNVYLPTIVSYFADPGGAVACKLLFSGLEYYTAADESGPWVGPNSFIAYQHGVNDQIEVGGQVTIDGNVLLNQQITQYDSDLFSVYTPTVANDGTTTYTTRIGWWQRIGKMVYFCAYVQWGAAGSGTTPITITAPTNLYRGTRQTIGGHFEGASGKAGHIVGLAFTGGTVNIIDRIRAGTGGTTNLTGADIANGDILVVEGWYREA